MKIRHAIYDIDKKCVISYFESAKEAGKKMRELKKLYNKLNLELNLKFKLINLDNFKF
jgi:hypothetical protein